MRQQDHAAQPAFAALRGLLPKGMAAEGTAWRRHLTPLGIPTDFIADDPVLLAAACAAYADCVTERSAEPVIELRLSRETAATTPVSLGIAVEGSRLTIAGGGITGWADAESKRAACGIPLNLVVEQAALTEVVDTLLLFILARSGRTPVHAAGVMAGATALVLAGPSGTGKSTLALSAAAKGLPVLSDDTLYVQREPALRVWGFPRPIHVFAEDAPAGSYPVRLRGGKRKAAIPVAGAAQPADRAVLILLERGGAVALAPLDPAEAVAQLSTLEPGFDLLAEQSAAAIAALAGDQAWRLTLSRDPAAAIDALRARFGAG
jgi:hypothetical protein